MLKLLVLSIAVIVFLFALRGALIADSIWGALMSGALAGAVFYAASLVWKDGNPEKEDADEAAPATYLPTSVGSVIALRYRDRWRVATLGYGYGAEYFPFLSAKSLYWYVQATSELQAEFLGHDEAGWLDWHPCYDAAEALKGLED